MKKEIKDLKNCKIYDNNEITIKMVKMGMDIDKERNHRIRGIVPASNGDFLFIEIMSAYKPNRKYFTTKDHQKMYDETYTVPQYIHIDFCFRVDIPEDYFKNYSKEYKQYNKKSYTHYDYTNENIIKILQEFNPNIASLELVDDYYLTDFCNEKGFHELYDSRLEHKREPQKILIMNDNFLHMKEKYSCYNYDHSVYYEEKRDEVYKNYTMDELYRIFGKDKLDKVIEEYNNELQELKRSVEDITI